MNSFKHTIRWFALPVVLIAYTLASGPDLARAQSADFVDGADPDRYMREYGMREVPVQLVGRGQTQSMVLLGLEAGPTGSELIFRPAGVDRQERIYVPFEDLGEIRLRFRTPGSVTRADRALREGEIEEAVELLRPVAWPLVRYAIVSEENFPIHPVLRDFFRALVLAERYGEAYAFSRELPISPEYPGFTDTALLLAEGLLEQDRNQRALSLINRIPTEGADDVFIRNLLRFANRIRAENNFSEALNLYRRIYAEEDSPVRQEAVLWIAYCNLKLNRVETARIFLDEAGELDKRETLFSLKMLIDGLIAGRDGDEREAMSMISRGVVFARIGYDWVPELLFQSARLYTSMGRPGTARNIYEQIELFFPDTQWAEQSVGLRERLPAPGTAAEGDEPASAGQQAEAA